MLTGHHVNGSRLITESKDYPIGIRRISYEFRLSKEKAGSRELYSASSRPPGGRANLIGAGRGKICSDRIWDRHDRGCTYWPIGTAALVEAIAGNYTAAFAAMAGCICAEFGLLLIAVFTVVHLNATSLAVQTLYTSQWAWRSCWSDLYYLTARRYVAVGGVDKHFLSRLKLRSSVQIIWRRWLHRSSHGSPSRLIKLPYYCVDPSFGCGLIHETFI